MCCGARSGCSKKAGKTSFRRRYPDTGLSPEADIGCDPTSQMNRSQALPEIWFKRVRYRVQSLGAGMKRQGYRDLLHGVTAYPFAALA